VFSTATQPAFQALSDKVRDLGSPGWEPKEIVPAERDLFNRAPRTKVHWPRAEQKTSWDEIAARLRQHPQVLCIVNLKRHALHLAKKLKCQDDAALLHLSTSMCPAHRACVLARVRKCLEEGAPCRLVSTQCVEAGVDLDFPVVYRAWGPLDAIAQAAGRCNRNGKLSDKGQVHLFFPEDEGRKPYPPGGYGQAAHAAKALLNALQLDGKEPDLDDPAVFDRYYHNLYGLTRPHEQGRAKELQKAICQKDFAEVAKLYRLIEQDAINVLVPYDKEAYGRLAAAVRADGLNRDWIRNARPHAVSLFRNRADEIPHLEAVPLTPKAARVSDQWFIYLKEGDYDSTFGLVPSEDPESYVV